MHLKITLQSMKIYFFPEILLYKDTFYRKDTSESQTLKLIMKIISKFSSVKYKTLKNFPAYNTYYSICMETLTTKTLLSVNFMSLLWLPSFSQLYCIV